MGGLFSAWVSGAPDNYLNTQDCGSKRATSGASWDDRICTTDLDYVCERMVDLCPNDPGKMSPGVCGCGTADVDSDSDGTLDCNDECPQDPKHIEPGACGCLGESNLKPAGASCGDGLCSANTQCDGSGSCGSPAQCAPAANCTAYDYQGTARVVCTDAQSWQAARTTCASIPGMDLARIDDAAEDAFIKSKIVAESWLGGSDSATEGAWVWAIGGTGFWTGVANGSSFGGAFTKWASNQPDDYQGTEDCLTKRHGGSYLWDDRTCTTLLDYVCESYDQCPSDPNKMMPGSCGCGHPETDGDGDDVPNCVDACPTDPGKSASRGICPCGVSDVDSDGDTVPDCKDEVPGDASLQRKGSCLAQDGTSLPEGTPCEDGPCRGVFECDGAGHCGDAAGCTLEGCEMREFGGKVYTFCPTPTSWEDAADACRSEPGRHLVQIDNRATIRPKRSAPGFTRASSTSTASATAPPARSRR